MSKIIYIEKDFNQAVSNAAGIYNAGGVFVCPTDTIYGLSCDPFNSAAAEKLMTIKGRAESKKFILLINSVSFVKKFCDVTDKRHTDFLAQIWPAPVTVILKLKKNYAEKLGTPTIALRFPLNEFCDAVMSKTGRALISTSVNRSGCPSMTDPDKIIKEFSEEADAFFISEKPCAAIASTIIDLTGLSPSLIREGGIEFNEIVNKF
jgi:L-threonylcarbamoyladenylate synthase